MGLESPALVPNAKGLERARQHLGRHAHAVVLHLDEPEGSFFAGANAHLPLAAGSRPHRLRGVEQKAQHAAVDLRGEATDARRDAELGAQRDAFTLRVLKPAFTA